MNNETSQGDHNLVSHQTFKIKTFLVIIDRLNVELKKRIIIAYTNNYKTINTMILPLHLQMNVSISEFFFIKITMR